MKRTLKRELKVFEIANGKGWSELVVFAVCQVLCVVFVAGVVELPWWFLRPWLSLLSGIWHSQWTVARVVVVAECVYRDW